MQIAERFSKTVDVDRFQFGQLTELLALEGNPLAGANYKPLIYIGGRPVKGVNHIFIAEQTLILAKPERHIVTVTINEYDGNYNVVSIERIV